MEHKYYILTIEKNNGSPLITKLYHGNLVVYLSMNKIGGVNEAIVFALEITKKEYDYYYE